MSTQTLNVSLYLLLNYFISLASPTFQINNYQKMSNSFGITSFTSSSKRSVIECAQTCASLNTVYMSFNDEIKICRCGDGAMELSGQLNQPNIYRRVIDCPEDLGFNTYKTDEGVDVCIKIHHNEASFFNARTSCDSYPTGRLFVGDTIDKFNLLGSFGEDELWIGFSDILVEDEWVFEDGRVATPGERSALFYSGEPNNAAAGGEDCAKFFKLRGKVYDAVCTDAEKYVCEIPV